MGVDGFFGKPFNASSVRDAIKKFKPDILLHGHIHESPDMSGHQKDSMRKTICINVGRDDTTFRFAEIDLDDLSTIVFHQVK